MSHADDPTPSCAQEGLSYEAFVADKANLTADYGFDVHPDEINPLLFPHQADAVRWACKGGRRALFEAFGLGKTFQQLEIIRLCLAHEGDGARGLIVCPLGVRQEFKADAAKLGIEIRFVRRSDEVTGPGMYLTNYESVRDGKLASSRLTAVNKAGSSLPSRTLS